MEIKLYKCPHCGNVVASLVDSGVVPVCCGDPMKVLDAKAQDGAAEKHVPVVEKQADGSLLVKVGSVPHPMLPEHHICFVVAKTANGFCVKFLDSDKAAETLICNCGNAVEAVYEYCNLHGLWTAPVE